MEVFTEVRRRTGGGGGNDAPMSTSTPEPNACAECTLINPPSALVCEACSAMLGGRCDPCLDDEQGFLIIATRLWDGHSDMSLESGESTACVAVVGANIAYVGLTVHLPSTLASLPVAHDLSSEDATILPGLIDCHVHLEFSPQHGLHEQPRQTPAELMERMQSRAHAMVRHGITTVRDLGGRPHGALALRRLQRSGECPVVGPRLLCAGAAITRPKGHCWQWGGEAANAAAIRDVIRTQLAEPISVDVVKIMATGGVRTAGTNPAESAFSEAEIRTAAECAHAHGRRIAAHAPGVGGILNAALAGVDTIEHCSWVDASGRWGCDADGTIEEISRRGIAVCPTIGAGWLRIPSLQAALGPALSRMRDRGVALIAGSDAGAIPNLAFHRLADGLVVMARCAGLTHAEALRAATSAAATALGLEAVCGALVPGLAADLLVVRGDPVVTLEALCAPPLLVVCRGEKVTPCGGGQSSAKPVGAAQARPGWARPFSWARSSSSSGSSGSHGGSSGSSRPREGVATGAGAAAGRTSSEELEDALGSSARCPCMRAGAL